MTLTASDLEELGFTSSEERSRLLRLIARLSSRTPGAKVGKGGGGALKEGVGGALEVHVEKRGGVGH